jgi:NAD-dependent dihydropyrimidine dehydrogenase PreA subunit
MIQRITIDETVCDGCLICIEACPTDVFKVNPTTGKPFAAYPDDCHVCFLCQEDCPLDCLVVNPELSMRRHKSVYAGLPREALRFPANQEAELEPSHP